MYQVAVHPHSPSLRVLRLRIHPKSCNRDKAKNYEILDTMGEHGYIRNTTEIPRTSDLLFI